LWLPKHNIPFEICILISAGITISFSPSRTEASSFEIVKDFPLCIKSRSALFWGSSSTLIDSLFAISSLLQLNIVKEIRIRNKIFHEKVLKKLFII